MRIRRYDERRMHRKQRFFSKVSNFIWSTVLFAGAIVLLIIFVKVCIPWMGSLWSTINYWDDNPGFTAR